MVGPPVAKVTAWTITDAEARKLGEQTGLDTLVVLAVNDGESVWEVSIHFVPEYYLKKLISSTTVSSLKLNGPDGGQN